VLGCMEKLTWPGVLSKKVAVGAAITSVTMTVTVVTLLAVKTTCPVYVPSPIAALVVTMTLTPRGVVQHTLPVGDVESQVPPLGVRVVGVTEKLKLVAVVLAIGRTCGSGSGAV